ncbi:SMP-30/gluconolactonase/LRE family protein [Bradyrhizobium sp. Arg237L]|uniref:SMP-30/gluconolactonase/LRE family protein n=1 Tax=Bradyrhizobium sp. Arg237L TaxID=3003352 RepID=UPI00249DC395|nr:SMP-30/gluconolactonase/LRE family protein [Bradyrhizobium sp. Arg237L]MDI4234180.1 SMP-30/gluconolactonase/LRE family protein [Bradyrhizobium sp. Arg237L]
MSSEIEGGTYVVLDPRFKTCISDERVERLWTGTNFSEGPAWFPAGRYLVWSDVLRGNKMMRWDETDGSVSVFREPSNFSNGNTVDLQGRLVTCEHLSRSVTRTEHDGKITTIASHFQGKRFNSPNDVVVKSDGSIWFSDPTYGIDSDNEGAKASPEIDGCHVYRVDPGTGVVKQMTVDMVRPNGLAFSPDESILYIADTGVTHVKNGPQHIRRFRVGAEGALSGGEVFAVSSNGLFDGFRVDAQGRIWTSAGDGIHCIEPDGTLIGKILIPEPVGNLTFGGPKRNRLLICATTSLYGVHVNATGASR